MIGSTIKPDPTDVSMASQLTQLASEFYNWSVLGNRWPKDDPWSVSERDAFMGGVLYYWLIQFKSREPDQAIDLAYLVFPLFKAML